MTTRRVSTSAEIRQLVEELEQACRESQQIRQRADDAMKKRVFWPERRRSLEARHSGEGRIPREKLPDDSSE